jgi:hypothetical protein
MSLTIPSPLLRKVLLIDAATCTLSGALMSIGAATLARWTAIPHDILLYAGLSLLPIALVMAAIGLRSFVHPAMVWLVIGGNLLWVLGCIWLLVGDLIAPNTIGQAFITLQALTVAILTKLEHDGLRQSRSANADLALRGRA